MVEYLNTINAFYFIILFVGMIIAYNQKLINKSKTPSTLVPNKSCLEKILGRKIYTQDYTITKAEFDLFKYSILKHSVVDKVETIEFDTYATFYFKDDTRIKYKL